MIIRAIHVAICWWPFWTILHHIQWLRLKINVTNLCVLWRVHVSCHANSQFKVKRSLLELMIIDILRNCLNCVMCRLVTSRWPNPQSTCLQLGSANLCSGATWCFLFNTSEDIEVAITVEWRKTLSIAEGFSNFYLVQVSFYLSVSAVLIAMAFFSEQLTCISIKFCAKNSLMLEHNVRSYSYFNYFSSYLIFFLFFFSWSYSPWCYLSDAFRLQLLMPKLLKSCSMRSSHLNEGLLNFRLPSGVVNVSFLLAELCGIL